MIDAAEFAEGKAVLLREIGPAAHPFSLTSYEKYVSQFVLAFS